MQQRNKEPIETSQFYMWRCVTAIAHIDGMVQAEERAYLTRIFGNLGRAYDMTSAQSQTLLDDLETPQNLADLIRHINDPTYRANLVYFGALLARADGIVTPAEEEILKKLHAEQLAGLDMEQIRATVKEVTSREMFEHDINIGEIREGSTLFNIIDALFLLIGIDILE